MPHRAPTFRQAKPANPAPTFEARGTSSARGYDRRWQKFRLAYLSANPLCVGFKGPCNRLATVADHIIPLAKGGAHCDPSNTQALCHRCHNRKTGEEKRTKPLG